MTPTFRKTLIATAALLAAGASFAQTTVTVPASVSIYGRLDMAMETNTNTNTPARTWLQNFSSRLGFKGDKAFNSDLKGIFQVETGIAPDDATNSGNADATKYNSKPFASRNSFVGLSSAAIGTVIIGNNDMPLKAMDGTSAPMWAEGDLQELIIHGKGSKNATNSTGLGGFDNIHTRQANMVQYTSPKFADVVVKLAYSPDEAAQIASTTAPAYAKPLVGASLYWDNGMFNAGYAYQSKDNAIAPTLTTSGYTLTGTKAVLGMKMSDWTAGLAVSTIDNGNTKKTNNWVVAGTYKMGQTTFKASYGSSSESAGSAADDLTATAIEADYALDKDVTLYTYYAEIKNAKNAKGTFAAADNFPAVSKAGESPTVMGLGIRYNF
jgi:predicted porin